MGTMSNDKFDPVEFFHSVVCREWEKAYERPIAVALPDEPEKVALRALAAEAAKQQARKDSDTLKAWAQRMDYHSEEMAVARALCEVAQAIEREAGL